MNQTIVANVRTGDYDIYIGRANRSRKLAASIWANPFPLKRESERQAVLAQYRELMVNRIASQPDYWLTQLEALRGKRLACWCAPKACHGDVLVELLNEEAEWWAKMAAECQEPS